MPKKIELRLRHAIGAEEIVIALWTPQRGFQPPETLVEDLRQFFLATEFADWPENMDDWDPTASYQLCARPAIA